jgi:hypothetical protein
MWFSAKPAVPRFTCSASPPAPSAPALFAQQAPDRVERLILTAFTYKGEGAAEIARRRARIEELRANPKRKRDAAMIRSIFSRDGHPNLYEPTMADALVRTEMCRAAPISTWR